MDTHNSISTEFEQEVRAAMSVPDADQEFLISLKKSIIQDRSRRSTIWQSFFSRPAWVGIFGILILIVVTFLAVGPDRVMAAVGQLLGYIPGVGIVEQSVPIRVLAEPVSITKGDVTVTVTSATLTGDRTRIDYRIFGVSGSAYPNREDVMGCTTPEYLRLPDRTWINRMDNDFGPVPAGIDTVTFVMPCIFNTLPGKAPVNWELLLHFVTAPPDLTVMPVIDLSPSPQASLIPETPTQPEALGGTSTYVMNNEITIIKEIETSDGYILVGQFPFHGLLREQVSNGEGDIRDSNGKKVDYTHPKDVGPNDLGLDPEGPYWFMQFKAAGLTYPLTIKFFGAAIQQADPSATAQFTFDAGSNPQPGQEWTPNQDIQFAGHTLKLTTIRADSRNGYNFSFQGDPTVISAEIQIDRYTPTGHGWGRGLEAGGFDTSLSFTQFPTGLLTVTLSNLTVTGETLTWQGQWTPATPRTDLPANPAQQPGLCLAPDTLAQLSPFTAAQADGKVLSYEMLNGTGPWGLVLYDLDGSQQQVATTSGNWGSLSPDGSQVAYSATDNGIHIYDVNSQIESTIPGAYGFDLHWSSDGKQIAYIGMGSGTVNSTFVVNTDGTNMRQISEFSYETIIGWSSDGNLLYFATPYTGGAAWKVYAYDFERGIAEERFTIENGTPKFLNPKLSLEGNWIAYRGQDNSSLYLVRSDGSDMHLVIDNAGAVGVEWSHSDWLAVSLRNPDSNESSVVILKPDGCETYRLTFLLQGDLEGLFIP
jgi:hypothetical protein